MNHMKIKVLPQFSPDLQFSFCFEYNSAYLLFILMREVHILVADASYVMSIRSLQHLHFIDEETKIVVSLVPEAGYEPMQVN